MDNILKISDLNKIFSLNLKKTQVLKWVNLSIDKWDVFWFLWPNWSWKTTTLKCILWFLKPTSWDIKIFWKDPLKDPEIFKKIWYAPENTYFYDHLNWMEFLIFMWELSWLSKQESELNWLDLLDKLWLNFAKNKLVKSYSKWMRQRLWLAASLINNPDLIFWDEPMSWLDPLWRILVKDLMKELKNKWKTLFFNTHILSDVQEIANKFGIIYNWKIIFEDLTSNVDWSLEDIFKEKILQTKQNIMVS